VVQAHELKGERELRVATKKEKHERTKNMSRVPQGEEGGGGQFAVHKESSLALCGWNKANQTLSGRGGKKTRKPKGGVT